MRTHAVADGMVRRSGSPAVRPELDDLLIEVGHGGVAAYEALYKRVCEPVYGIIRRVLRDPAQSEEVAQEVLLQVWQAAPRFDRSRGSAWSWVMTIAHRRAVDRVRSEQSMNTWNRRYAAIDGEQLHDTVADDVQSRLERQTVIACLAQLSDLQREAVQLAFYDGYTHSQVARILGIPLGTGKTRIRDGLIRLRRCLDDPSIGAIRGNGGQ